MINVRYAKTSRFNQCQSCLSALNCIEILIGANENQLMRFTLCELCAEDLLNDIRYELATNESSED